MNFYESLLNSNKLHLDPFTYLLLNMVWLAGRPQSMPTATSEENQAMAPVQRNTIIDRISTASSAEVREAIVADFGNSNCSLASEVDEEQIEVAEWPGPKPSDVTTGSTMDNFKFFRLEIWKFS